MEKYVKEYQIRTYECDKNGFLRIVTLMNIFQDIADSHATDLGLGMEFCLQNGLAWVGSNYHIKINRLPKLHEIMKVITWPSEEKKLGAIRDFVVYDEHQNEIITASSQWILIDFVRKRPVVLKERLPQYKIVDEHSLVSEFAKLPEVVNPDFSKAFSVRFDDIDINMHVNNSIYPLWASEGLPTDFRENYLPKEIEISFKKEGHLGEDVEINSTLSENTSAHSVKSLYDNRELSRIKIKWAKK